jgi:TolB-like protein
MFKGKAVDVKEVGRRLGVRYLLEGSVREASGKVRITGQLIDAVTGTHLWADRFERELTDILFSRTKSRSRLSPPSSQNYFKQKLD